MIQQGMFKSDPLNYDTAYVQRNAGRYNGRVNIIEPENPDARFQMYERIVAKNKSTPYREALLGDWENSSLAQVFFSAANIDIIQNALRTGVYNMSKQQYIIAPQNVDVLKTIMRTMFIQYGEFYPTNVTEQVERLNKTVLDYSVPYVYGEAVGYMRYLQDQSTLVMPLAQPRQPDRVYKQLELKPWF